MTPPKFDLADSNIIAGAYEDPPLKVLRHFMDFPDNPLRRGGQSNELTCSFRLSNFESSSIRLRTPMSQKTIFDFPHANLYFLDNPLENRGQCGKIILSVPLYFSTLGNQNDQHTHSFCEEVTESTPSTFPAVKVR